MTLCKRCGREASTEKLIPLSGTSRAVVVCEACYDYLNYSDDAYERFVVLARASDKLNTPKVKKNETSEDLDMKNSNGRPTTWTKEQVEEAIRMRNAGASISEIAKATGKTDGAVSGKLWQLRKQGKLNNEEPQKPPEEFEVCEESTEEPAELSPLEKEMAAIIEEQREELQRLALRVSDLEAVQRDLAVKNEYLEQERALLAEKASDLEKELQDTKSALEETERQFDEYRRTEEGGSAIIKKLESDLEHTEAEISRLIRAEERATRIALGVVEKFALGGECHA